MLENIDACCEGTVFTFTSTATNGNFRPRANKCRTSLLSRQGALLLRDELAESVFTEMRMMPSCNDIASDAAQLRTSASTATSNGTPLRRDTLEDVTSYRSVTRSLGQNSEVRSRAVALERKAAGAEGEHGASDNDCQLRKSRKFFKCDRQRNGYRLECATNFWEGNKIDPTGNVELEVSKEAYKIDVPGEERRNKRESCAEEIHVFEERKVKYARCREQDTCRSGDGLPKLGELRDSGESLQDTSQSVEFYPGAIKFNGRRQNAFKPEECHNGIARQEQGILKPKELLHDILKSKQGISKTLAPQLNAFNSSFQQSRQDVDTTAAGKEEKIATNTFSKKKSSQFMQPVSPELLDLASSQRSQTRAQCKEGAAESRGFSQLSPKGALESASSRACSFVSLKSGVPTAADFERMRSCCEGEISLRARYCSDIKDIFRKDNMQTTDSEKSETFSVMHRRPPAASLNLSFPSIHMDVEGVEDDSETSETSTTGVSEESLSSGSLFNLEESTASPAQSLEGRHSYNDLTQSSQPSSTASLTPRAMDLSECRNGADSLWEPRKSSQETEDKVFVCSVKQPSATRGRYGTNWRKVCEKEAPATDALGRKFLDWYGSTNYDCTPKTPCTYERSEEFIVRDSEKESERSPAGQSPCRSVDHQKEYISNPASDLPRSLTSAISTIVPNGMNEGSKSRLGEEKSAEQSSECISNIVANVTKTKMATVLPIPSSETHYRKKSLDIQTDSYDSNRSSQKGMPLRRQAWPKSFKRKTREKVSYFESWLGRGKKGPDTESNDKTSQSSGKKDTFRPSELLEGLTPLENNHDILMVNASQSLQKPVNQRVGSGKQEMLEAELKITQAVTETQRALACVGGKDSPKIYPSAIDAGQLQGPGDIKTKRNDFEAVDDKHEISSLRLSRDVTRQEQNTQESSSVPETAIDSIELRTNGADEKRNTSFAVVVKEMLEKLEDVHNSNASPVVHVRSDFEPPAGKKESLSQLVSSVLSTDNVDNLAREGSEKLDDFRITFSKRQAGNCMQRQMDEGSKVASQERLCLSFQGLGLAEQCGFVFEKGSSGEDGLMIANDKEVHEVTQHRAMHCRRDSASRNKFCQSGSVEQDAVPNGRGALVQGMLVMAPERKSTGQESEPNCSVHVAEVSVKALVDRFSNGTSKVPGDSLVSNCSEHEMSALASSNNKSGALESPEETQGRNAVVESAPKKPHMFGFNGSQEPSATKRPDMSQLNGLREPSAAKNPDLFQFKGSREPPGLPIHEAICNRDTKKNEVPSDLLLTGSNLEANTIRDTIPGNFRTSFPSQCNLTEANPLPIKFQDAKPSCMDEKIKEAPLNRRHKMPMIVRVRNRIANGWFLQHPLWKRVARKTLRKGDCPLLTNKRFNPKEVNTDPPSFRRFSSPRQTFDAKTVPSQEKVVWKSNFDESFGKKFDDAVCFVKQTVAVSDAYAPGQLNKESTRYTSSDDLVDQNVIRANHTKADDSSLKMNPSFSSCKDYAHCTDLEKYPGGDDDLCEDPLSEAVGIPLSVSDVVSPKDNDCAAPEGEISGDQGAKQDDNAGSSTCPLRESIFVSSSMSIEPTTDSSTMSSSCQTEPMKSMLGFCRGDQESDKCGNSIEAESSRLTNQEVSKCSRKEESRGETTDNRGQESMNVEGTLQLLNQTGGTAELPKLAICQSDQPQSQVANVADGPLTTLIPEDRQSLGSMERQAHLGPSNHRQQFGRGNVLRYPFRSALPGCSNDMQICTANGSGTDGNSKGITDQERKTQESKEFFPPPGPPPALSLDSKLNEAIDWGGDKHMPVVGNTSKNIWTNCHDRLAYTSSMPNNTLAGSNNRDNGHNRGTLFQKDMLSSQDSECSSEEQIFLDRFSSISGGQNSVISFERTAADGRPSRSVPGYEICLLPKAPAPHTGCLQAKVHPCRDRPYCGRSTSFTKTAVEHNRQKPCAQLANSAASNLNDALSLRGLDSSQACRNERCSTCDSPSLTDFPLCWDCPSPTSTKTGSVDTPDHHFTMARRREDFHGTREQKEAWRQVADILQEWKSSPAPAHYLPSESSTPSFPTHYQNFFLNRPQCSCSSHASGASTPRREDLCHHGHHLRSFPLSCNYPSGNSIAYCGNRYYSDDCCHPFQTSTIETGCHLMGLPPSCDYDVSCANSSRACSYSPVQTKQSLDLPRSRPCGSSRHSTFAREGHQIKERASPEGDLLSASNSVTAREPQQGLVRLSKEEMNLIQQLRLSVEKREIESMWKAAEQLNEPNTAHENELTKERETPGHSAVALCRHDAATCIQKSWRTFVGKKAEEAKMKKLEKDDRLAISNGSTEKDQYCSEQPHFCDHHQPATIKIERSFPDEDTAHETSYGMTNKTMKRAARIIQHAWRSGVEKEKIVPSTELPRDIEKFYELIRLRQLEIGSQCPSFERFSKYVRRVQAATEGARVRRRLKSRRLRTIVMEIKEIRVLLSDMSEEATCESTSYLFPQLSAQLQHKISQLSAALNSQQMEARFLLRRPSATPLIKSQSRTLSPKLLGVGSRRMSGHESLNRHSSPTLQGRAASQKTAETTFGKWPSISSKASLQEQNPMSKPPGTRFPNHSTPNKAYNPPLNPSLVSLSGKAHHELCFESNKANMDVSQIQSDTHSRNKSKSAENAQEPCSQNGANSSLLPSWLRSAQTSPCKHTRKQVSPTDLRRGDPDTREVAGSRNSREIKTAPAPASQNASPNSKITMHQLHRNFDELPLPFPQWKKPPEMLLDEMGVGDEMLGPEYLSDVDYSDKPKRPFLKRKSVIMPSQKLDWSKVKPMVSSRLEPELKTKLSVAKVPTKEPPKVPSKKKKANYSKVKSRLFSYEENVSPRNSGDGAATGVRAREVDSFDPQHSASLRSSSSRGPHTQYSENWRGPKPVPIIVNRHRAASPDLMHLRRCMAEQERNYAYAYQAAMRETQSGSEAPYSSRYNSARYEQKYGSPERRPPMAACRNNAPSGSDSNPQSSPSHQQRPQRIRLRILPRSQANEVEGLFVQQVSTHSLQQEDSLRKWEYQQQQSSGGLAIHHSDAKSSEVMAEGRQERGSHRYAALYSESPESKSNDVTTAYAQRLMNADSHVGPLPAATSAAEYNAGLVRAYQHDSGNVNLVIPHAPLQEYQQQPRFRYSQEVDYKLESNGNRMQNGCLATKPGFLSSHMT